jgi:hypothetical protein
MAKLIAPDGFEDRKHFETQAAAMKWALGEGLKNFDGDIQRAEIHHETEGLKWFKDRPKDEADAFYLRMRSTPTSELRRSGLPHNLMRK